MATEATTLITPSAAGPTQAEERISFIDVLRGFALFGVLAANMRGFNAPAFLYDDIGKLFPGRADVWTQTAIDTLISAKFITLFSFLFGLGFAVMFDRISARGASFARIYPRRLLALAAFGLIQGMLIWWGDVLFTYAIGGFLLFCFRRVRQKTTLIWSASILTAVVLIPIGLYIATLLGHGPRNSRPVPDMNRAQQIISIYAHGTLPQIVHRNFHDWLEVAGPVQNAFLGAGVLFIFLLGLYVWRAGIVQNLEAHRPLLKRVCSITLPLGLACNVLIAYMAPRLPQGGPVTLAVALLSALFILGVPILSCGYASGLALLYLRPAWRRRLAPLAPLGRMALTNYLMESVICVLFYSSLVTGLFGRVGPFEGFLFTLVLYVAQVLFSIWWFRHYRFGPMEWFWRGLTYGKFPAMQARRVSVVTAS